jgi:hypothetical protein
MESEELDRIQVLPTGELLVGLKGEGNAMYQYVYRASAGVHWDEAERAFKSTPMKEWSCTDWYRQIVSVVSAELGVVLRLGGSVRWAGLSEVEKAEILNESAI